jgi:hypothetical protein
VVAVVLGKRKKDSEDGPKANVKCFKMQAAIPRLVTFDWLAGIHNSVKASLAHGLEWCQCKKPRSAFNDDFELLESWDESPRLLQGRGANTVGRIQLLAAAPELERGKADASIPREAQLLRQGVGEGWSVGPRSVEHLPA